MKKNNTFFFNNFNTFNHKIFGSDTKWYWNQLTAFRLYSKLNLKILFKQKLSNE